MERALQAIVVLSPQPVTPPSPTSQSPEAAQEQTLCQRKGNRPGLEAGLTEGQLCLRFFLCHLTLSRAQAQSHWHIMRLPGGCDWTTEDLGRGQEVSFDKTHGQHRITSLPACLCLFVSF